MGTIAELPLAVAVEMLLEMLAGIGTGFVVGISIGLVGTRLTPGTVIVPTVGKGMRLSIGTGLST